MVLLGLNPLARRDGGIGIQPCCKLGEADKITRPACDIRIEDIHAILFDGIEQLPVVPFQDTAQAFIGSPGVLFGIPFAQENALHKTLRIPFKNPFGIHLHGAYANIIGKVVCPRHLRQIIQA